MSLSSFFTDRPAPTPPARPRIQMRRRLIGRSKQLRALSLAAGVLSLGIAFGQPAQAATKYWNGETADWYSDPTFWSPSGFPGASDDAANTDLSSPMTLGATGQSATVQSFVSNSAFTLEGGVIFSGSLANDASTLQINNIFTLDGGQVNNFTVNKGIQETNQPAPTVVVTGNGGNSINNSIVNANLDLSTHTDASLNLYGAVTENGAISLGSTGNALQLVNNASLTLGSTGSLVGFGSVHENSASTLTNNGLINANSPANPLSLALTTFTNNGTAEATNGATLSLANTNTNNNGNLTVDGMGSVVSITGTYTGGSGSQIAATNGGQVHVSGANLLGPINGVGNTSLIFDSNTSSLNSTGASTLQTVNINLDLSTHSDASLNLYGTVTENGMISLGSTGNALQLVNNASLTLGSTGSLVGFGSVHENSASTLTNNGLINANSPANPLSLALTTFTNNGTAEATNGATLSLANTNTNNNGNLTVDGMGSVVSITGTYTGGSGSQIAATNGGQVHVSGANLLGPINGVGNTSLIFDSNTSSLNSTGASTLQTVNINLDLSTHSDASLNLYGTVTENGEISLGTTGGNSLQLVNNANLTLSSTGSLVGFGSVHENSASTLTNNNLINANSTATDASSNIIPLTLALTAFNNSANATTEATKGATLNLSNTTTTNDGLLSATGGSTINLTGTLQSNADGSINSQGGTFNVSSANLLGTINGVGSTTLIFDSNTSTLNNTGAGTLQTSNINLDLSTHNDASLNVYGTVTENGEISLGTTGGNSLQLVNNASLTLGSTGSLVGFGLVHDNSSSTLTNNGLINANSSANALTLAATAFNNSANATTEATKGATLNLSNTTTTNDGLLSATGGSTINLTHGATLQSNADGSINSQGGTFNVSGTNLLGPINGVGSSSLIFDSDTSTLNNTSVGASQAVNINLDLSTHNNASLNLYGAVTENGEISLGTTGGNSLQLVNDANLTLGSTGSLVGFGLVHDNSSSTLNNNGTINANNSTVLDNSSNIIPLTLALTAFNNSANATTEATKGATLNLSNTTTTNDGLLSATGGSTINLTHGATLQSNADGSINSQGGTFNVSGTNLLGTINGVGSSSLIFDSDTSTLNNTGAGTLQTSNINLDLSTHNDASLNVYGNVTENGEISLGTTGGNSLQLVNNASLTLGSTGSLVGFGLVHENSATTLTNNGLINANSTGNTLSLAVTTFNNAGTTQVTNGAALNVTSATTNTGNVIVNAGGAATFTQGITQTAGLTQVDGVLNSALTLNGGFLQGNGNQRPGINDNGGGVFGNVVNNGGTVRPTAVLDINGNFTQNGPAPLAPSAPGGTLAIGFTNSFHSLLNVTGTTTLGGILDVNFFDPSAYTGAVGATPFAFLDYSTLDTTLTNNGFTQYFTDETATDNNHGTVMGHNGFEYELINDTTDKQLQLEVTQAGSPVPEASTTVSFGLMLAMGLGGLALRARAKKRSA